MYTITVTYTRQSTDDAELFSKSTEAKAILPEEIGQEIARVKTEELDVKALLSLVWKTPRRKRSDAGKKRAEK